MRPQSSDPIVPAVLAMLQEQESSALLLKKAPQRCGASTFAIDEP